jgi:hypothetical protein
MIQHSTKTPLDRQGHFRKQHFGRVNDMALGAEVMALASSRRIAQNQAIADQEDSIVLSSQLILGTALIIVNAVFHVSCLVWLAHLLIYMDKSVTSSQSRKGTILLLCIAVLGLIAIHTVSTWAWAIVYLAVGEFTELSKALYFSIVTSTTLGYGDITVSERWQLLAGFEAMGGLILFGASTAFLIGAVRTWFGQIDDAKIN